MERIRGFDGLRALAALAVIATHLGLLRGLRGTPVLAMVEGFQAVHLFFALSGFLITTLLIREQRAFGRVSIGFFYARRALRIFPLYFLCLGVVAVLHATLGGVTNGPSLIAGATYTYNFLPRRLWSDQLSHTWSLAVEEHFYLAWPLVFVLLFARSRATLARAGVLACLVAIFAHACVGPDLRKAFCVAHWTCFSGTSILFGCLAALACGEPGSRAARFLRSRACLALALVLWGNSWFDWLQVSVLPNHLRGLGFAMLVGWIHGNQGGWAVRVLDVRPLRYLGTISYGLYMVQGLLLTARPERVPGEPWPLPPWLGLVLLAVAAPLSYRFLELPLLRLGRRFRQRATAGRDRMPEPSRERVLA